MTAFAIMQEPGARAHYRRRNSIWSPPPKRAGTIDYPGIDGAKRALEQFRYDRYIATGVQSYGGYKLQWSSAKSERPSAKRRWNDDDGTDNRERDWRLVVLLQTTAGRYTHDAIFYAWRR